MTSRHTLRPLKPRRFLLPSQSDEIRSYGVTVSKPVLAYFIVELTSLETGWVFDSSLCALTFRLKH